MSAFLCSAREEAYLTHIQRCLKKLEIVFPSFSHTVERIFQFDSRKESLKETFVKMVLFHDIGKLTKKWQEKIGTGEKPPPHATIGAAYLWKILPEGIREPVSFAVAIHHTDKGLLGDNIERPDVQAIVTGIVSLDGKINWHPEVAKLEEVFFPGDVQTIDIDALKEMARGLRIWAKGCSILEQHQRRLQALLTHHIIKLCDVSAATERKEYQKESDRDYYGGWLMVKSIKEYVDAIGERGGQ